jgi:hypothetical protein
MAMGAPDPAGMTLTQMVITGVAAVVVFVAVLVLVLHVSRRRAARVPGDQDEESGPFGLADEAEYGGAAAYGRPAGYGPLPLWHDVPSAAEWGWRLE